MKMFLLCLITLSFACKTFTAELCASQIPCWCKTLDNEVIDISSVGSPEHPRFYQVSFQEQCNVSELYLYNPCFSFDSPDKLTNVPVGHLPCTGAAACIRTPGGHHGELPEEYLIGSQSSAKFQTSHEYLNHIKYTVPKSNRSLIVRLICKEGTGKDELEMVNCASDTDIVLNLVSKCACPNGCSSAVPGTPSPGLSVGSKLLIAFFTILLAYFIVGVFWNYCNGSHGVELIPNVEFWNDLPTLIMEGVSFACSCCGRQSSYGEV